MRDVVITREPVELYKILKFEGLAQNGGEAKAVIEQGLVKVNQVVETRKRKQIVAGDRIEYGRETLNIVLQGTLREAAPQVTVPKKRRARLSGRALPGKQK